MPTIGCVSWTTLTTTSFVAYFTTNWLHETLHVPQTIGMFAKPVVSLPFDKNMQQSLNFANVHTIIHPYEA
jgi:hypothetical protein